MSGLPNVTVIVPVYNAEKFIGKLLYRLSGQDYPAEKLEIIIVDNGSTDDTKALAAEYPFKILEENKIQSSYAARNKGIENAAGEVLAFTDADCQPLESWVSQGVDALIKSRADIAAGKVEFIYSQKPTAAEIFDSITHMQIESEVIEKGVAPTANLFVKREMFEKIGKFNSFVKSGGDMQWTAKAAKAGFKLIYSSEAVVKHPSRNLAAFLKKVIRTGAGSPHKRLADGHSLLHEFFYTPYAVFFKVKLDKDILKERFCSRGLDKTGISFSRVMAVGLFCNIVSHISALVEFWRLFILILLRRYKVDKSGR